MLADFDIAEIPVEFLPFFEPDGMIVAVDAMTPWGAGAKESHGTQGYKAPAPIRKSH